MKTNHVKRGTTNQAHTSNESKKKSSKLVTKRGIQSKHSISHSESGSQHNSKETPKLEKKIENNGPKAKGKATKHPGHPTPHRSRPLNGITIAISTLNTGTQHEKKEDSYKYIVNECKAAGACVSGQVGKKVFAVVCNRSAVLQCTQRVRKAVKKNVMLVDIEWVRQSVIHGKRLDCDDYLLDDLANEAVLSRKDDTPTTAGSGNDVIDIVEDVNAIPASAWSEPVSYGCCCVCHENGDKNCKWCNSPPCSINAKLCVVVGGK